MRKLRSIALYILLDAAQLEALAAFDRRRSIAGAIDLVELRARQRPRRTAAGGSKAPMLNAMPAWTPPSMGRW